METKPMTDLGIASWLRKRHLRSGASTAVVFEGVDLSYGEMATRVLRLAEALRSRGIAAGDRVAYLGDNHPSFLETMFASAALGSVFVPLNTRLAAAEIAYQLQDSGSTLLVHSRGLAPVAEIAAAGTPVAHRIVVGDGATSIDGDEDYEQVIASSDASLAEQDVAFEDPALILYTSGTTGRPKGAILTHANFTWNAFNVLVDYDLASSDRALMVSPLFHVASLGMGALPAILKGATVVLERRFDAERVLKLIEHYRITWLSGVPTTFQMLCDSPGWDTADLGSLKNLTCGGSPVPPRVRDAYERRGLAFSSGYGMTEASPGVTSLSPAVSRTKAGTSGQPHFFTDVRIRDPDADGVGEIEIRGRNVTSGYWNRPDDSAASFADGGWFRTGDLGALDVDGYLTISDRLRDVIISGGENIYPAEVELVVAQLDGVESVAVIGVPDAKWGEVPIAVLTLRAGCAVTEAALRGHLDGRIARYKIPKRIFVVESLPRTASGKVLKSELRQRYASGPIERETA
jgi:fatty-acyl-CoA synthase